MRTWGSQRLRDQTRHGIAPRIKNEGGERGRCRRYRRNARAEGRSPAQSSSGRGNRFDAAEKNRTAPLAPNAVSASLACRVVIFAMQKQGGGPIVFSIAAILPITACSIGTLSEETPLCNVRTDRALSGNPFIHQNAGDERESREGFPATQRRAAPRRSRLPTRQSPSQAKCRGRRWTGGDLSQNRSRQRSLRQIRNESPFRYADFRTIPRFSPPRRAGWRWRQGSAEVRASS